MGGGEWGSYRGGWGVPVHRFLKRFFSLHDHRRRRHPPSQPQNKLRVGVLRESRVISSHVCNDTQSRRAPAVNPHLMLVCIVGSKNNTKIEDRMVSLCVFTLRCQSFLYFTLEVDFQTGAAFRVRVYRESG